MYTDLFGKTRYKINLHTHTTMSDGLKTPAEASQIYRAAGYDCLALTDHWVVGENAFIPDADNSGGSGITLLRGCEYNAGTNVRDGAFHIVGIGMERDPGLLKGGVSPQDIIDAIKAAGGAVVLAHPAWSLNQVEQVMSLRGFDALEIYNTVSGIMNSERPYSGGIADLLACRGFMLPLAAVDDTHYYTGDSAVSSIMLEADSTAPRDIVRAVRDGRFYATQGPELHIERRGDKIYAVCSPVDKIAFFSDTVWAPGRVHRRPGMTEAEYKIAPTDTFVRAEATDGAGRAAWSGYLKLSEE